MDKETRLIKYSGITVYIQRAESPGISPSYTCNYKAEFPFPGFLEAHILYMHYTETVLDYGKRPMAWLLLLANMNYSILYILSINPRIIHDYSNAQVHMHSCGSCPEGYCQPMWAWTLSHNVHCTLTLITLVR